LEPSRTLWETFLLPDRKILAYCSKALAPTNKLSNWLTWSSTPPSAKMHIHTLRQLYYTTNSIRIARNPHNSQKGKQNKEQRSFKPQGLQISILPTAQNTSTPPHAIRNTYVSS
jgi:hypothetical protein